MRKTLLVSLILLGSIFNSKLTGVAEGKETRLIKAVPFTDVEITDGFWAPRMKINQAVSIPQMLKEYDKYGRPNPKLIEAASYVLAKEPDRKLEQHLETLIDKMFKDFLSLEPDERWKDLKNGQLYGAGHFLEAAVAYYQATGNKKTLDEAIELADHIDSVFGPDKRRDVSGHEEVKIGLLKLYNATGDDKYFKLAKFFLDERGHRRDGRQLYGEYAQDHKPVIKQDKAVGHCVRATYLYTPLAEIAKITRDAHYAKASERIWNDAVSKRMYLIGNFGSHRDYEDFGDDYELPNLSCWNETCTAIGNVFWNHKLFLLNGHAKYIDVMERTLYNGFLVGLSLGGQKYFYQNVLQTFGDLERHPWFGPNCCPPNVVRLMATLGSYIYAQTENELYVNLFVGSRTKVKLCGQIVEVRQSTRYPWDGVVKISINPAQPVESTIYVRVPGWAQNQPVPGKLYRYMTKKADKPVLKVNGRPVKIKMERGFAAIKKNWEKGDVIELELPMEIKRVIAHKKVLDTRGRVALERGPLVYCAEGTDNGDNVFGLMIADDAALKSEYRKNLLNGVVVINGEAVELYRGDDKVSIKKKAFNFTSVPYYAWANRKIGQMAVWLARDESKVFLPAVPAFASASRASCSCGNGTVEDNYPGGKLPSVAKRFYPRCQSGSGGLRALYDQIQPISSADGSCPFLRLRPQKGDRAWVQYDFTEEKKVSSVEVYWKDDKEYCLIPKSWRVVYWDLGEWKPVKNHMSYKVKKDKFNKVTFEAVDTSRMRLEIQLQGQKFEKGQLGPPDANYLKEAIVWYECGIIECRIN